MGDLATYVGQAVTWLGTIEREDLEAGASIATAVAAWWAFGTWRGQLKRTESHQMARSLMDLTYRLMHTIRSVRFPVVYVQDRHPDGRLFNEDERHEALRQVYAGRLGAAGKARSDLEERIIEALSLWDEDDVRDWFRPIIEKHSAVETYTPEYLDSRSPAEMRRAEQGLQTEDNKKHFAHAKSIAMSRGFDPDELDRAMVAGVKAIRKRLKRKML